MKHRIRLNMILGCLCASFLAVAAYGHAETIVKQSINVKEAGKYEVRIHTQVSEPGVLHLTIEKPGLDLEEFDFSRVDVTSNTPPNAVDDVVRTDEDNPKSANLLLNDTDYEDDPLTVTAINGQNGNLGKTVVLSSQAKLTVNANGAFVYDPSDAFQSLNDGQDATDQFVYEVSDGNGGTDVATVTLTIDGITDPSANTPPDAVDDIRRTDEDTAKSAGVLWNDSDAENDPLTVVAVNGQAAND